jgi:hypothetical protein
MDYNEIKEVKDAVTKFIDDNRSWTVSRVSEDKKGIVVLSEL